MLPPNIFHPKPEDWEYYEPSSPWICYFTWQKGFADVINVTHLLILKNRFSQIFGEEGENIITRELEKQRIFQEAAGKKARDE